MKTNRIILILGTALMLITLLLTSIYTKKTPLFDFECGTINIRTINCSNLKNVAISIDRDSYIIPLSDVYGGGFLVISKYFGIELLGNYFSVTCFDANWSEQECGYIQFQPNFVPLAVVEMKTNSDRLPKLLRDQWIKCIVLGPPNNSNLYRSRLIPDGLKYEKGGVIVTPIRWPKYINDYKYGINIFSGSTNSFEFR